MKMAQTDIGLMSILENLLLVLKQLQNTRKISLRAITPIVLEF